MSGHTKGQWRITLSGLNDNGVYCHQIGTHEKTVAYTWVPNEHNTPENDANARLIVAARSVPHECDDHQCPGNVNRRKLEAFDELVSALKLLLPTAQQFEKQASMGTSGRRGGPVFEKARAAIAKATEAEGAS